MLANRLGELLIREQVLSAKQLEECLELSKQNGGRLVDALLVSKVCDESTLLQVLSKHYRLPIMDLSEFNLTAELSALLPSALCVKNALIPVGRRGNTLVIAVSDPTNIQALDDVRFQSGMRVEQVLAAPSSIRTILERSYGVDISKLTASMSQTVDGQGELVDYKDPADETEAQVTEDDAPIVQFVSALMVDAVRKKASDIHIEPYENELRIRIRIDGDLVESFRPPSNIKTALVARIKVMAKLRLDEKRLPQDGRLRLKLPEGRMVDLRVSTMPTIHGEKAVLRILDKSASVSTLESVGFEKDDLEKFEKAINAPWGMCLVTGATGSGKTTTLYAAINALNKPDVNISTIEDPVEFNFVGINQVQTKEKIGLTFAETLRAILRQDPDVVLLGEIRDGETAEVAMKAALTGHVVLSTLHTNDAPSTIMRMRDMGIEPFLINSALLVVVAQRLVRRICPECKEVDTRYNEAELVKLGFPAAIAGKFTPMRGKGCNNCRQTGNQGRCAIHEVMVMTETLKEKIGIETNTAEIRKAAIGEGMKTLRVNCMRKITRGLVSIDELLALGSM